MIEIDSFNQADALYDMGKIGAKFPPAGGQGGLPNQQFAINRIADGISHNITSMKSTLKKSYAAAISGELSNAIQRNFTDRWSWYGDLLVSFNVAAKKLGNLSKLSKEEKALKKLGIKI